MGKYTELKSIPILYFFARPPINDDICETLLHRHGATCMTVLYSHGASCVTVLYRHGAACLTVLYRHGASCLTVQYRQIITTYNLYCFFKVI